LLESLRDETGYAASLVVRDGRDVVYLHRAPSRSPFSTSVSVGTRLPAHATVLGHVLLGDLSLGALKALYPERRLESRSANTPADAAALFELVQQIRARGWVLAEGFFEAHICTVAAAVRDQDGRIVAAIGLTVPGSDIPEDRQDGFVASVCDAAGQLSNLLNFRSEPVPRPVVVPLRRAGA
jgi:DNA-binding IclR family transcriptional regulator